jgi:hypothetical protein
MGLGLGKVVEARSDVSGVWDWVWDGTNGWMDSVCIFRELL